MVRSNAATALALLLGTVLGAPAPAQQAPTASADDAARRDAETEQRVFRDCPDCPLLTVIPSGPGDPHAPTEDAAPTMRAFALGAAPVTFGDWAACAASGAYCQSNPAPSAAAWARGPRPVVFVSWDDIAGRNGFLDWLNAKVSGAPYRLPSAAEYAQAAQAGVAPAAWRAADAARRPAEVSDAWRQGPMISGGAANPRGAHNLRGDAWEWVQDCDGEVCAALRRGPWPKDPLGILPENRIDAPRGARSGAIGFRVARTLRAARPH